MLLTDDEVLAIAKREGQKLALGKNPNIDIDFARSIEAAVLKKLKQQEPVAFEYGIGTSVFSIGEYTNWIHQVTSLEPNTPLNAIRNLRPLYAAPMPADDVVKDAEIERLTTKNLEWLVAWNKDQETIMHIKGQLAESQARFEQLEKQLWYERGISFRNQLNETQRRLEEAQAREAKLRDAMNDYFNQYPHMAKGYILDALSIPADNTALREMIAKAGEVMRERCVEYLDSDDCFSYFMGSKAPGSLFSEAIRALPGVTMEDLK